MKKVIKSALLMFLCVSALAQTHFDNAYLVLRRTDGVDVYYKIPNGVKLNVNNADIATGIVCENSPLEFAFVRPPSVFNAPAIENANVPEKSPMRIISYQECSNNDGVHFRMFPLDGSAVNQNFAIEITPTSSDCDVDLISRNEVVLRNHQNKKVGSFSAKITAGNETKTYSTYSTTCNHSAMPTDCEPNNRAIFVENDKGKYQAGDEITVVWERGNLSAELIEKVGLNWYGDSFDFIRQEKNEVGYRATFRIKKMPLILHAQPGQAEKNCHGWTELVIY